MGIMSLDTWKGVGSIFRPRRMLRKTLQTHGASLRAFRMFGPRLRVRLPLEAQAPPAAAPAAPVAPATLNRLFSEAEAAFTAKDYRLRSRKSKSCSRRSGPNKDAPLELLYFNIGLGNLLAGKPAEAEAGFTECLKRFPKGEYASRCWLGIGRACIDQGTPEKKERAIEALKLAAPDPKFRSEAGLWLGQVYTDLGKREEALDGFQEPDGFGHPLAAADHRRRGSHRPAGGYRQAGGPDSLSRPLEQPGRSPRRASPGMPTR